MNLQCSSPLPPSSSAGTAASASSPSVSNASKPADATVFATPSPDVSPSSDHSQPHAPLYPENNGKSMNNLMFMVRHVRDEILDYSVISTKNDCFEVVQDSVPLLRGESRYFVHRANYCVLASCDRWLLISCTKDPNYPYDLLWDPSTNEARMLHCFPLASPRLTDVWAYGVGIDPSGEYKVVRCRVKDRYGGFERIYAEVLSLGSDSWKEIQYPYPSVDPYQHPSLHINGFYYWTAYESIVSFDFANDKFLDTPIPMPESPKLKNGDMLKRVTLAEFKGSLAAIVDDFDGKFAAEGKLFNLEIWVWNGGSWSRVSTCNVPAAAVACRAVGLYKNDKVFLQNNKGDLLLYHYGTDKYENLGIHNDNWSTLSVVPFIQSFPSADRKSKSVKCDSISNIKPSADSSCSIVSCAPASGRGTSRSSSTLAHVQAPSSSLKHNNSNNLIFIVQHVLDGSRKYSVISTENNSFKVVPEGDDKFPDFSLLRAENYDPLCRNSRFNIIASCNTWMLWMCGEPLMNPWLCLWEPMKNEFINFPDFEVKPHSPSPILSYFRDPGIGFVPTSGDYKVVRCRVFEYESSEFEVRAELFSLESLSWKEIPYPHDPKLEPCHSSPHINGFYYWLATDCDDDLVIISFDFVNEVFPALIPIPEIDNSEYKFNVALVEFNGLLGAVFSDFKVEGDVYSDYEVEGDVYSDYEVEGDVYSDYEVEEESDFSSEKNLYFEIWVWNDGSWSRQVTCHVTPTAAPERVVCLYKNKKVLLQDMKGELLLYDCVTHEWENLNIYDDCSSLLVFPYVQDSDQHVASIRRESFVKRARRESSVVTLHQLCE